MRQKVIQIGAYAGPVCNNKQKDKTMTKPHGEIEMLEKVKAFLGGIVIMRGYGQEEYDIVCNLLRDLEATKKNGIDWSIQSTTTEDTAI